MFYILLITLSILIFGSFLVQRMHNLFSIKVIFNRKYPIKIENTENNKIIKVDNDGNEKLCQSIRNLKIKFLGKNNKIILHENVHFTRSEIILTGNNITFEIGKNSTFDKLYAIVSGSEKGNIVKIGENFFNTHKLEIFAGGGENNNLYIGNNVLCSRQISIYTHDGHSIHNFSKGNILNNSKNDLIIGNNVWIGHGVIILKNTQIKDNTIIGAGSVVCGSYDSYNSIIAGNPAKIVKENVYWNK